MPIIAITTNSSTRVKPYRRRCPDDFCRELKPKDFDASIFTTRVIAGFLVLSFGKAVSVLRFRFGDFRAGRQSTRSKAMRQQERLVRAQRSYYRRAAGSCRDTRRR